MSIKFFLHLCVCLTLFAFQDNNVNYVNLVQLGNSLPIVYIAETLM